MELQQAAAATTPLLPGRLELLPAVISCCCCSWHASLNLQILEKSKDVPKSAKRKAVRGWSASFFIFSVSRTTLRGQLLGVVANWLVQIGIETYICLFRKSPDDVAVDVDGTEKVRLLGRRVTGATLRCCGSLVFASIGAGIGAIFHPSVGQWIGCAIGDFAGPIIVTAFFEQHLQLSI